MSRKSSNTSTDLNHTSRKLRVAKKVFVGLSGGVDSAVSAALLKEATPNNFEKLFGRPTPEGFRGYDVTGVFIKAWQPEWLPCTWREERRDAMKVAIALDIPFLFFDFGEEYKKGVVDKMVSEYKAGRTPNPDVLCNREIKFGIFWQKAKEMGADFIATGHYSQVEEVDKLYKLKEGEDKEKDQSYFLWTLTQEDLQHTLFPIGHLKKEGVRRLALKYDLPVAEKKDSQGICFLGDVSMEEFLSHFIKSERGSILDTEGQVVGTHSGAVHYTIGERRGLEISKKSTDAPPFYVVSKDIETNTLVVSNIEKDITSMSPKKISLSDTNWINEPSPDSKLTARIRYRGEKLPVTIRGSKDEAWEIEFDEPVRSLSLGQSVVFYSREKCLGGAIMDREVS
ncbi:MAG: tRNA 2-thiouridine(34) synthase MnmA [Parcubacteria group bacterium]